MAIRLAQFILVALLAIQAASVAEMTADEESAIIAQVKAALPGALIKSTARKSVPDEWKTFDEVGLLVEGKSGNASLKIWFLPKDWIGIRSVKAKIPNVDWEEGILVGEKYKAVVACDSASTREALENGLKMYTPSLVNSGWDEAAHIFKGRFDEADRTAQRLIKKYCNNQDSRDKAAHSLVVLGVPAKNVLIQCALGSHGRAQEACVDAIGLFGGGKDIVNALCKVMTDPGAARECPKSAAMMLGRIGDPDAGPALEAIVEKHPYIDAVEQAAFALERIGRVEAAPKIFDRMEREAPRTSMAKVLATMRYEKAIPAIRKMCEQQNFTAEWALDRWGKAYFGNIPEVALIRFIGDWGKPVEGVRFLLLPPGKPMINGAMTAVAIIENTGKKDVHIIGYYFGELTIDGQKHQLKMGSWDGYSTLRIGNVWVRPLDLKEFISKAGKHEIQYSAADVKSSVLTIDVKPARNE
jgi:hypothetical protein